MHLRGAGGPGPKPCLLSPFPAGKRRGRLRLLTSVHLDDTQHPQSSSLPSKKAEGDRGHTALWGKGRQERTVC